LGLKKYIAGKEGSGLGFIIKIHHDTSPSVRVSDGVDTSGWVLVVPHFPAGALIGAKKNFDGANYVLLVLCGNLHASFGASDPRPRRTWP